MRMRRLPERMWLRADDVVRVSWKRARAGRALTIPGWRYQILSAFTRFAPRPLIRRLGMNLHLRRRPGGPPGPAASPATPERVGPSIDD